MLSLNIIKYLIIVIKPYEYKRYQYKMLLNYLGTDFLVLCINIIFNKITNT